MRLSSFTLVHSGVGLGPPAHGCAFKRATRVEGNEVAVSRFAGDEIAEVWLCDEIAEVWLWYDGYYQAATTSSSRSASARPSSSAVPDF